jgi:formate hydrogenlyase subunit 3/multisubunit Na+/H+ antiporter MnhD subunit
MRRRRDLLVLGMLATLVLVVTLGPLVVAVVQTVRDPPPQYPGLVLFGLVGAALDRLAWSLGVAIGVVAVLVIVAAIDAHRNREPQGRTLPRFWRTRSTEERAHGTRPARLPHRT